MTPAEHTPTLDPNTTTPPPAQGAGLLAEPTFEECVAEYTRYFDDRNSGKISVRTAPEGHYVAYFAGKIHDHDADATALRARVAAVLGIHPALLVVDYPWMW
jgi:hypothetical protein